MQGLLHEHGYLAGDIRGRGPGGGPQTKHLRPKLTEVCLKVMDEVGSTMAR